MSVALRAAISLSHIHARHRDASGEELFVHPALSLVGIRGQRGRVENPRLRLGTLRLRRKEDKRGPAFDSEVLAWKHKPGWRPRAGRFGLGGRGGARQVLVEPRRDFVHPAGSVFPQSFAAEMHASAIVIAEVAG